MATSSSPASAASDSARPRADSCTPLRKGAGSSRNKASRISLASSHHSIELFFSLQLGSTARVAAFQVARHAVEHTIDELHRLWTGKPACNLDGFVNNHRPRGGREGQ